MKGCPVSAEDMMLNNVLNLSKDENRGIASVNSTFGMSGAGKTTALRALCSQ